MVNAGSESQGPSVRVGLKIIECTHYDITNFIATIILRHTPGITPNSQSSFSKHLSSSLFISLSFDFAHRLTMKGESKQAATPEYTLTSMPFN
jgi:hypothetical protein